MTFQVIPGIDVAGGRLVRLSEGGPLPLDAFGGDPVSAATAFAEAGASLVHVVDVDLAMSGEAANLEVLASVAAVGVPVQASGGIRTRAQVEAARGAGAERVVLGSAGLADRETAEALVVEGGEALVVGIEAHGATIRPRGSPEVELSLWETIEWLRSLPVARLLFTEVRRTGGLDGPDLDGVWAIATNTAKPVLAAGGIRGVADLRRLAALGGNVEGAVVGRALYEGLDLGETLAALR